MSLKISVIVVLLLPALPAFAQEECVGLIPKGGEEVTETFKGSIEGEVEGAIARLAGGSASIEGEYLRLESDTLKNYPDAHKVFVWQSIIYLACVRPKAGIDINELFKLYLAGPPSNASEVHPNFQFRPGNDVYSLYIENSGGQILPRKLKSLVNYRLYNWKCGATLSTIDFVDYPNASAFAQVNNDKVLFSYRSVAEKIIRTLEGLRREYPQDKCYWDVTVSGYLKWQFEDRTGSTRSVFVSLHDKFGTNFVFEGEPWQWSSSSNPSGKLISESRWTELYGILQIDYSDQFDNSYPLAVITDSGAVSRMAQILDYITFEEAAR